MKISDSFALTNFILKKDPSFWLYCYDLMNDARMDTPNNIRKHDRIQMEIVSACRDIGMEAIQNYTGQGWRADVFIRNNGKPIAFEIQLSPQSLRKTLERQSK